MVTMLTIPIKCIGKEIKSAYPPKFNQANDSINA